MTKAVFWILLCTALISLKLKLLPRERSAPSGHSMQSMIQKRHEILRRKFKNPENADFLISVTLGEKKWLNPSTKKLHRQFNLVHLFTPSGLHFSSLMLIARFFLRSQVARSIFYLAPLFLGGFYSCKRVGLLLWAKQLFPSLSLYAVFLMVMAVDFSFGTFKENPLSFLYSFTFLGIFIVCAHESKLRIFVTLILTNMVLSYFQETSLAPWGILVGLVLTPLFSLGFPLLFITLCFSTLAPISEFVLNGWFSLLKFIPTPQFYLSASLPLLLALFFYRKLHPLLFIFLIFLHSEDCFNEKKRHFYGHDKLLPHEVVSVIKRNKSGYRVDSFKWGLRCRYVILKSEWRGRCTDLPAWKKKLVRK